MSRRQVLAGGLSVTAVSLLGSLGLAGCSDNNNASSGSDTNGIASTPMSLDFAAVSKSLADRVVLPAGYSAQVLYALGDPISANLADCQNDGQDDGHWDLRSGDHHDAMAFFPLPKGSDSSDRGLLAVKLPA